MIAFSSDRSGQQEIWVLNADDGSLTQLTQGALIPPDGLSISWRAGSLSLGDQIRRWFQNLWSGWQQNLQKWWEEQQAELRRRVEEWLQRQLEELVLRLEEELERIIQEQCCAPAALVLVLAVITVKKGR